MDREEGRQLLEEEDEMEEMYMLKPKRSLWRSLIFDTSKFIFQYSYILLSILLALSVLENIYLLARRPVSSSELAQSAQSAQSALFSTPSVTMQTWPSTKTVMPSLTNPEPTPDVGDPSIMPLSGAFAGIPRISALPERQRRMTIVGAWNDDATPAYLHQFFYSIQLNADVLDLLLINRLLSNESRCADFEKAGMNITWGGNIKIHCMENQEWKRRHVDFMCSSEYGWDCNATEYEEVTEEFRQRRDEHNYNWRPFRGHVFRDLFQNPENPFWAWMDHDLYVGNFARYPFNVLSQVSIVTGNSAVLKNGQFFMAGQLTAFNFDDAALGTAWKKFPELKTPAHFTKYIDGYMPKSSEERYWSYGYLRSVDGLPGSDLSYGILPDVYGDDYFDGHWIQKNAKQTYVISGRDVLLVATTFTRQHIEDLIKQERSEPIDDLGSIGWTTDQHAVVEEEIIHTNCSGNRPHTQCIEPHPFTLSDPPTLRPSLLRRKEDKPGHIWRRLERDMRPRGYERKLFRHHLKSKKMDWFEFPPFAITEDMVLRYNSDSIEVFKMGPLTRDTTVFFRKEGEKSIG